VLQGVSFVWDEACQKAFEEIKEYLTKPPVLVAPVLRKPFMLYVRAMDHSLGALLTQKNDKSCEHYLSKTLIRAGKNPVEKECLALLFVVQKHDII